MAVAIVVAGCVSSQTASDAIEPVTFDVFDPALTLERRGPELNVMRAPGRAYTSGKLVHINAMACLSLWLFSAAHRARLPESSRTSFC